MLNKENEQVKKYLELSKEDLILLLIDCKKEKKILRYESIWLDALATHLRDTEYQEDEKEEKRAFDQYQKKRAEAFSNYNKMIIEN